MEKTESRRACDLSFATSGIIEPGLLPPVTWMKMKKGSFAGNDRRPSRRKLIYVKSVSEIPDFRSDDEIAAWYQTHSTVLIQDQLETLPAKVEGKLRAGSLSHRRGTDSAKRPHSSRSAS